MLLFRIGLKFRELLSVRIAISVKGLQGCQS
jgi:hypothetical protein